MTLRDFTEQCRTYLPKQGCKIITCDAFLSMNGITYKCTFTHKDKFFALTCTHYNIWRLRCENELVAETGHTDIAVCCDRYFKEAK